MSACYPSSVLPSGVGAVASVPHSAHSISTKYILIVPSSESKNVLLVMLLMGQTVAVAVAVAVELVA